MSNPRPQLTHEEIWRRYDAVEARLTAGLSERMLDLAGLAPGMRVLDIATGRGEPALRAALRVGPSGSVVGVELDSGVLEMAKESARALALTNLDLRVGNAESIEGIPPANFHVVTARWCLMYMSSPVAALKTARRALLDTGVLVAALWAEPERVHYYTLPRKVLARIRKLPPIDFEVPGAFRFGHLDRIVRDFGSAGLLVDEVVELEVPVFEAESAADIVAWSRAMGMTRLLNEHTDFEQDAWEREFTRELEATRNGQFLRVGGVTRIVRARPIPDVAPEASPNLR